MVKYKIGPATVRMHGQPDKERIKLVTEKFLKRVQQVQQVQEKYTTSTRSVIIK